MRYQCQNKATVKALLLMHILACVVGSNVNVRKLPVQAKGEDLSLAELQAEINKHQRELVAMQAALPSSINLGLAALQLGKVRSTDCELLHLACIHVCTLDVLLWTAQLHTVLACPAGCSAAVSVPLALHQAYT